jgi:type II secretory pathway component PulC
MRLSCTVIAQEPAAVIKYQGKSRILRVGDTIDGYELIELEPKRAVLRGHGETLHLVTQKAPETLERDRLLDEGLITVGESDSSQYKGNY